MRLLRQKDADLREREIQWRISGIASRRLGWIADESGLDIDGLLSGETPTRASAPHEVGEWLQAARADVVFEATSLEPRTGQPAIDYLRAALEHGAHAITANKGPVVHAFEDLQALARSRSKCFLFESAVMDGVPIFSLFRENLPVLTLQGFHGVLNSTTNVILSGMEEGMTFEASLKKAQEIGVAETDAGNDIDGWDAAVKTAALVRVLLKHSLPLDQVQREGIGSLTKEEVRRARAEGRPYKLVCRARRTQNGVEASVGPERLPLSDAMAWVAGTSSIICFETDIFPGLTITEIDPGVDATAYGMLADFVRAVEMEGSGGNDAR